MAGAGVIVVSGMARGIDAIAHAAALDAGGGSVGILGNGFGVIYPAVNRALYERMVARGRQTEVVRVRITEAGRQALAKMSK